MVFFHYEFWPLYPKEGVGKEQGVPGKRLPMPGSATAPCRSAAASAEAYPTSAPDKKLMKGGIAAFWGRHFSF